MAYKATTIIGDAQPNGWKPIYYGRAIGAPGTKYMGQIKRIKGRYHYEAPSGESGSMAKRRDAISKLSDYAIRVAVHALTDKPRVTPGRPVANPHGVNKKTWTRWKRGAQRLFNAMMDELHPKMQSITSHPNMPLMNKEHWEVLRWNAAFLAASNANKLL
jgi:hypothetical protein